jgi:hypothetical protein
MTEAEWLGCTDPQKMLEFLRGKDSDRKLRLFACSCCHRVVGLLPDEASRSALDTCERFADGLASAVELQEARQAAISSYDAFSDSDEFGNYAGGESASAAVAGACWSPDADDRYRGLDDVIDNAFGLGRLYTGWRNGGQIELRRQCRSLRDIFGNPFLCVTINPAWLTWNDGTVQRIAQAIYDERGFDRMPILADALEEAGCTNADILNHCRQPGEHVRGCWVVDLVLGKE